MSDYKLTRAKGGGWRVIDLCGGARVARILCRRRGAYEGYTLLGTPLIRVYGCATKEEAAGRLLAALDFADCGVTLAAEGGRDAR